MNLPNTTTLAEALDGFTVIAAGGMEGQVVNVMGQYRIYFYGPNRLPPTRVWFGILGPGTLPVVVDGNHVMDPKTQETICHRVE